MRRRRWSLLGMVAVLAMVAGQGMLGTASAYALPTVTPPADKVLFFASDGMRPDLMQTYAKQGAMPTYNQLMNNGVTGENGLLPAFPPNTGVGWYTLMTGTWPSEHGSTNNTYFRTGDAFTARTSFSGAGSLQADTLAAAAERAGKTVAQVNWVGGVSSAIAGPTVDFATFYSNRGVVVPADVAADHTAANTFGVNYLVSAPVAATGWTNVPLGDPAAHPKEGTFTIPSSFAPQNPNRTYNLYFFDSIPNKQVKYDTVYMVPGSKNGALRDATLTVGDFKSIRLSGANGLIGTRAGESAGFHVKLISMANDLSDYKIYFTSIARAIATCSTAACNALPAGAPGENKLEKYIADNLPPWSEADFAAEEAGLIDEDTYVQQGRELQIKFSNAVEDYILGTLQPNTDLAFVGYPFTDEVSHQFMALLDKTDMDGAPNPYYDDADANGIPDGRVAQRGAYIKSAYSAADDLLKRSRKLLDPVDPTSVTTFASSDHGFAPQWYAINANQILNAATVHNTVSNTDVSLHASNASASNCSALASDLTKACWAGGTTQIYINPTLPAGVTYDSVRQAVRNAFNNLTDPAHPGKQVLLAVMNKEELRNVQGDDSLFPNRSGDVVVVSRPPYQWDAPTANVAIAFSHFFGQHGYLPNTVDIAHDINMHSVFVAAGPGVAKSKVEVGGVRAIDLAPTIAYLMRIPGPIQARGRILYPITTGGSDVVEA
ncbi:MAG TPA: alkaline phosphatase family protein, partial [Actinomycetota bacterium]|nr:alkaline phosphatase family protein [Actinomycetota bacterium]